MPGEVALVGELSTITNAATAGLAVGDLWNGLVIRLLIFCKTQPDTKLVCNDNVYVYK